MLWGKNFVLHVYHAAGSFTIPALAYNNHTPHGWHEHASIINDFSQ